MDFYRKVSVEGGGNNRYINCNWTQTAHLICVVQSLLITVVSNCGTAHFLNLNFHTKQNIIQYMYALYDYMYVYTLFCHQDSLEVLYDLIILSISSHFFKKFGIKKIQIWALVWAFINHAPADHETPNLQFGVVINVVWEQILCASYTEWYNSSQLVSR